MTGRQIRDPKALRALAHPLRWTLIDLLGREGTVTATRCAEVTGESVANCSYHLNTLAKNGYIEHAEGGQGREKPWRLAGNNQSWSDVGLDDEAAQAARAATMGFLEYQTSLLRERFLALHHEPEDWRDALGLSNSTQHLTVEELAELRDEVNALLRRVGDRDDPEKRPPGTRPVSLFFSATVAPRSAG